MTPAHRNDDGTASPEASPAGQWQSRRIDPRAAGSMASPYFEWARATRFAYYGTAEWLPVLIELRDAPSLKGTAQAFATLVFDLQARSGDEQTWAADLRVPRFYAQPSERISRPTRCLAVLARRRFLDRVYRGDFPSECIRRFELGRATSPSGHAATAPTMAEPQMTSGEEVPVVVTGVIDDGIPFAHDRFASTDGTTRIEYFWDQQVPSALWGDWGYGREIRKRDPVLGIDKRMAESRYASVVDEDEVYRRTGHVDQTLPGHKPLAAAWSHGAHVMDLACNARVRPAPQTWPIVAVQLPTATVEDTSGATLGPQVYNGLCYVLAQADAIAGHFGTGLLPVVVNVSYGTIAGPHDGSSLLETAIDDLIESCNATRTEPFRVVLPAGNNHLSRCHASLSLEPGASRTLAWRVLPDDGTESHVEIWLPPGTDTTTLSIAITAPDGATATGRVFGGLASAFERNGQVVALAAYYLPETSATRAMVRFSMAPTGSLELVPALSLAPAGVWCIDLHNGDASRAVEDIHAWIQRDDTAPGYRRRGRQSYFDDPDYRRFDDGGRAIEDDADPRTRSSYVRRDCTLNAIATGRAPIVIGGFRRSDGRPAPYSANGPLLQAPGSGAPGSYGPDAMLPSDDSPSARGVLAAGTRSGTCTAMKGTSVAAPQAARLLAKWLASKRPSDRQALSQFAATREVGKTDTPPAKRGGGGRIQLPSNRRPR